MALPQAVLDLLLENARNNGSKLPSETDDLFEIGALDSFTLVDLVSAIEQNCGIKIPDGDVNPGNFQTIAAIDTYIQMHAT
jgi:acyl carrier protein